MIERYTRPKMGNIWRAETRFQKMLEVEVAVAQVQANLKLIPRKAADEITKKARFSLKRINEIEKVTKHDVIAFVSNLAENVGDNGKYIHYGCTSSDILDTALSLQIKAGGEELIKTINLLEISLKKLIKKHQSTICAGRTHGMQAEPTTFGFKMAGFLAELQRNKKRLQNALSEACVVKLSGAVGTYSNQDVIVEAKLAKKLSLPIETIATQVVPRDRHAFLINNMAILAAGLERLAIELRHLQRSEVSEVVEGFTVGQKGSSAMPHKKNPISAENISGLVRIIRSYSMAAQENIALWHERDISHSSVERVILPDSFILLDYITSRMNDLIKGLYVDKKSMLTNLKKTQGQIYSSQLLLAFVESGFSREEAYKIVQSLCHNLKENQSLEDAIKRSDYKKVISPAKLKKIFSGQENIKHISNVIKRVL